MSAEEDHDRSEKIGNQSGKRDKKRKRKTLGVLEVPSNGIHQETAEEKVVDGLSSPQRPILSGSLPFSLSSLSPGTNRQNPFSLPHIQSPSYVSGAKNESAKLPVTPPQKPSSLTSSPKHVVQLKDDSSDDDDDDDYSPRVKRKGMLKFSSPRSPKTHGSPKKVSTRDKLLNRKRDLEEERRKLPIWTGIPFMIINLL
jgi:hypothetical protein